MLTRWAEGNDHKQVLRKDDRTLGYGVRSIEKWLIYYYTLFLWKKSMLEINGIN